MTPEQVAALSACWKCLPDFRAALLFLLATNAGMTIEQVIAGSACWRCLSDFQSAELFLLNEIVTNGTGGGGAGAGCMQSTSGDPEGVLVSSCTPALAVDPATSAIYLFTGVAGTSVGWSLKV